MRGRVKSAHSNFKLECLIKSVPYWLTEESFGMLPRISGDLKGHQWKPKTTTISMYISLKCVVFDWLGYLFQFYSMF